MRKMRTLASEGLTKVAKAESKLSAMLITRGYAMTLYTMASEASVKNHAEAYAIYDNFKADAEAICKNM